MQINKVLVRQHYMLPQLLSGYPKAFEHKDMVIRLSRLRKNKHSERPSLLRKQVCFYSSVNEQINPQIIVCSCTNLFRMGPIASQILSKKSFVSLGNISSKAQVHCKHVFLFHFLLHFDIKLPPL